MSNRSTISEDNYRQEMPQTDNNSEKSERNSSDFNFNNVRYRSVPNLKNSPMSLKMELEMERNELMNINNDTKVNLFTNNISNKINYLEDSQLFLEFKLLTTKNTFRTFNFIVLSNTVFLTFIEIIYKQFDVVNSSEVIGETAKNILLLLPFVITSIITLLSAWIKSLKFEELIENVTRGIEKSITAKSKLSKINEEIYVIKLNLDGDIYTKLNDIISTKYKSALKDYLDALTIIDKNWNAKDCERYIKDYLKTKQNECEIELGKKKIYLDKYEKHIENKKKEIGYREVDMGLDNFLNELEIKDIDTKINLKLNKKKMENINNNLDNEEFEE